MASPLEHFVVNVRSLSTNGNYEQLCDYINKTTELLLKNAAHLDDVLATLDLQEHSLGILAILCIKFDVTTNVPDFDVLSAQVQEFITGCIGEQIRFAPDIFADLCHSYTKALIEKNQALKGIPLLIKAIQKLQMADAQVTSVHADLCALCLKSLCLKPALQFLEIEITDINKENDHYDVKNFLLYYYYGGCIYTALKNYERALYFFEVALATPAVSVSHIMVEAYKKHILLSLIVHGKLPTLPKYTSQIISRFIKPLSQVYHELANYYIKHNPDGVVTQINKNRELLQREGNLGLVKQVLQSLYKKNIQRLTKTFLTLSLSDMASRVKLSNSKMAETCILSMINDGEIFASINQKDGMVVFLDNPEKYNSPDMFKKLETLMKRCVGLDEQLKKMDQEIVINPKYIQKSTGLQEEDLGGSTSSISSSSKLPPFSR